MLYLNGHKIEPTIFPDQTSQVWKIPELAFHPNSNQITWNFSHEGELLHLAQLRELIATPCHLHFPYLPYARQDKEIGNDKTFALRVFAKLINKLIFDSVSAVDPHSEISNLIRNFRPIYPSDQVVKIYHELNSNLLCFPDKGAVEKYARIFSGLDFISGSKTRNQSSGEIEGIRLSGDPSGHRILIVDDICDGGATFCKLAQILYLLGANEVNLFVSHGIFSKGLGVLKQANIKRIFTFQGEMAYDTRNFV